MAEKNTDIATRQQRHPYSMLERFANEIDDMFEDFGFGRGFSASRRGRNLLREQGRREPIPQTWAPDIEVSQQKNELVVRADLPGMKREDISVDVTEHELTISGERRQEYESNNGGFYRTERSYGSFCRTIPLPEGAMTDQANATFRDGVLEVRLPSPPDQVTRGRKLEIKEGQPETAKRA